MRQVIGPANLPTVPSDSRPLDSRRMTGVLTFDTCPGLEPGTLLPNANDDWLQHIREVLALLRPHGGKATFFLCEHGLSQGTEGIEAIAREGHEIGLLRCNGADRRRASEDNELDAISTLRATLQQKSGQIITGFRDSLFPLEHSDLARWTMLANAGFQYDSSVIPYESGPDRQLSLPRYPFRVVVGSAGVTEWPLTTAKLFGNLIPLICTPSAHSLPYWFVRRAIQANNEVGWPAMIVLDVADRRELLMKLLQNCALGTLDANIRCQKPGELTTVRLKMERAPKPVKQPCVTQQGKPEP